MSKVLYRYEIAYRNYDDDTSIILREYPVIKETERTYFIKRYGYGSELKRVSKYGDEYGFNTYAYSSKKDAKDHFIRRTSKRISWYEYWIEECKKGLELIKEQDLTQAKGGE